MVTASMACAEMEWIASEQLAGLDAVGLDVRMSYGFMLNNDFAKFKENPDSFGHLGVGGALGFADPAKKLAFSFCPNRIAPEIGLGPYARRLIDAAAACV